MNTSMAAGVARMTAVALVLGAAIAAGLIVGNALNAREGNAGWSGGAAATTSRVATANFSESALEAVRISRGDAAGAEVDYFRLHPQFASGAQSADRADEESDYHQRHPELSQKATRIPPNVE